MERDTYFFFKGRVALYAILQAIGIKPGDEVILAGFTCVVVPNAVVYCGAKPVYVDIDPATYNIDPGGIEDCAGKKWSIGKAKAIIVQHTFGIPAELERIAAIAKKYNLYVVEDACHSISSMYNGGKVGTFGHAAFFSSQWSKPVTTGLGGWAIVNDPALREKMEAVYNNFSDPSMREVILLKIEHLAYMRLMHPALFWKLRDAYRKLSTLGVALGSSSRKELECVMPENYAKKMSSWQKALLERKLAAVEKQVDRRKATASEYEAMLKESGIESVRRFPNSDPVFLRYPLLVEKKARFLEEARAMKLEIGDWFVSPLHPIEGDLSRWGYEKGTCPVAESVSRRIVNLPVHEGIDGLYFERLRTFLRKTRASGIL